MGQIAMITSGIPLDINQINKHLPDDITLWALAVAPPGFKPRHSILMRHYRYYLDTSDMNLDVASMQKAAQHLIGSHDYVLLSKPDGIKSSRATLLNACITESERMLTLDTYGTSFLWKLVRKIVSLLIHVGTGELDPEVVPEILQGHTVIRSGIRPAAPECLVLIEAITQVRLKRSKLAVRRVQKQMRTQLGFLAKSTKTLSALNEDSLLKQQMSY